MPPMWKVRREASRLWNQFLDLPLRVLGPTIQRRRDRDKRLRITEGALPPDGDTAILLVFPTEGIRPSVLETLEHFAAHGVAPTVVSNLPLSDNDRAALARRTHLVIERPNHGYDFGGYRDAALELASRGAIGPNLFVLNDSIWFPLSPTSTLIEDARTHPADLFGIYLNRRDRTPHRSHLQSYFYRFGPRICGSLDLAEFWRDLVTYDSKDLAVRRCEMRLTNWFAERGYSVGSLYGIEDLYDAIAALAVPDRHALMEYLVTIGDKNAPRIRAMMADGTAADDAAWHAAAHEGRLGQFPLATHPVVLLEGMDFPVMKRDRQAMYRTQRAIAAEPRYAGLLTEAVRREVA